MFSWKRRNEVEEFREMLPLRETLRNPHHGNGFSERSHPAAVGDISNVDSIENNWRLLSEQVFASSFPFLLLRGRSEWWNAFKMK